MDYADIVVRDVSRLGEMIQPKSEDTQILNISVFGESQVLSDQIEEPITRTKSKQPLPPPQIATRNIDIQKQYRQEYPEICTPNCEFSTCSYKRPENFRKPCQRKGAN